MKRLRIGIYGQNGHQIHAKLCGNPDAELAAVCCVSEEYAKQVKSDCGGNIKDYNSLEEMLADDSIDLISLCSPVRADQAQDAIKCLRAGKHVYAEKPAAFSEKVLDEILAVSLKTGYEFHEMADSVYIEPYWSVRKQVRSGKIGEIVQVYVQKSYPMRGVERPQNEEKDGGLVRQAGIHAIRFLEHITGLRVEKVRVYQTHLGNINEDEGLFTASSWAMTLSNGAVASACINYLNPRSFKKWGNECVRLFGTEGMVEITDGATDTHIYTHRADEGAVNTDNSDCQDFFGLIVKHLLYGAALPMTQEEELHPLRVVIRAFDSAETVKKNK